MKATIEMTFKSLYIGLENEEEVENFREILQYAENYRYRISLATSYDSPLLKSEKMLRELKKTIDDSKRQTR